MFAARVPQIKGKLKYRRLKSGVFDLGLKIAFQRLIQSAEGNFSRFKNERLHDLIKKRATDFFSWDQC